MLFEYRYSIGADGVHFSLVEGAGDELPVQASAEDILAIKRYIMQAWQDAINHTATPEEIGRLMPTPEGQKQLAQRAEQYLGQLLENFPPDLDRRRGRDRRKSGRPGAGERRRLGKRT
jgi:hypothetical protein